MDQQNSQRVFPRFYNWDAWDVNGALQTQILSTPSVSQPFSPLWAHWEKVSLGVNLVLTQSPPRLWHCFIFSAFFFMVTFVVFKVML